MMFTVLKLAVTVPDLLCDCTWSTLGFECVCVSLVTAH